MLRGPDADTLIRVEFLRAKYRVAPVTVVLAVSLVVVFLLEVLLQVTARPVLLRLLALSGEGLAAGYWWTLLTHLFLHANALHLLVNLLGLWFLGPEVEAMLGRTRFLILYLVSGVAGGLLQVAFSAPSSELVGASGSVCGLLLAFTTACPDLPLRALLFFILPVSMKARTLGIGLIVFSLVCAVFRILPQIGHLAHLGGAVAGAALAFLMLPKNLRGGTAPQTDLRTEQLLRRVVEEGLEGLSREERRALEKLAGESPKRRPWSRP